MTSGRAVAWGGIHNARDLGGLTGRLGTTKFGRVYRMPRPDPLDEQGWRELEAAGVRTLVDLRNDDEIAPLPLRPGSVDTVVRGIEDQSDAEFMAEFGLLLGTPQYYAENLRRWPDKVGAAISAVADAPVGGVVIHCSAGRDRTGLITALLLELVGVHRDLTLDDYEVGMRETNAFLAAHPRPHERARSDADLAAAIAEAREHLNAFLSGLDLVSYLTAAGLRAAQLDALQRRMLEPKALPQVIPGMSQHVW